MSCEFEGDGVRMYPSIKWRVLFEGVGLTAGFMEDTRDNV